MKTTVETMDKDTIANVTTLASAGISLVSTETILTIVVLFTALVLNIVRIYSHLKGPKKDQ